MNFEMTYKRQNNYVRKGRDYSSVVENLPHLHETLGPFPSTAKMNKNKIKIVGLGDVAQW